MFVGEGPGSNEDAKGVPFVGRAGKLLDKMIESIELSRKDVYVCNVVCCRPPNNRKPEPREVANCAQYLVRQLRIIRPKVIVALGATAATSLTGKTQKVGSLRGKWFEWDRTPLRVTYHPAFLLRNSDHKIEAHADLKAISAKVSELEKV
jgi:DNA polymerase